MDRRTEGNWAWKKSVKKENVMKAVTRRGEPQSLEIDLE